MKHKLILAALTLASASAFAIPLEIVGKPLEAYGHMQADGNEVRTKAALREIIPNGWRTLVHKEALLPATISWKNGQPWPSVLEKMAIQNELSVTLDWANRRVIIRKSDGTLFNGKSANPTIDDLIKKESPAKEATPEAAEKAATMPAPGKQNTPAATEQSTEVKATVDTPDNPATPSDTPPKAVSNSGTVAMSNAEQAASAERQHSTPVRVVAHPVVIEPVKAPIAHQEVAVKQVKLEHVAVTSSASQSAQATETEVAVAQPVSIKVVQRPVVSATQSPADTGDTSGTSLRATLAELAKKYHVDVVWRTEPVNYAGDLSVAGLDLGEDLGLVYAQLGAQDSPVSFELYRQSEVLVVSPNVLRKPFVDIITTTPYSGKLSPRAGTAYNLNAATR